MIDYADPPCRICGTTREPHGRMYIDHRFRPVRSCDFDHGAVATWYVNGQAACSAHKGRVVRLAREAGEEEPRLTRIDRGY